MEREAGNRELRPAKKTFTYAESGDSSTSATPKSSPGKSSFYGSPESTKASPGLHDSPDSEDELQQNRHEEANDEDEIVVGMYQVIRRFVQLSNLLNSLQPHRIQVQFVNFEIGLPELK